MAAARRISPPNERRVAAPPRLDPTLLREAVKMVDKCMARLQELQCTLAGGRKVMTTSAGLSTPTPTTTTPTYFRTKQESLNKIKNGNSRRISPSEKLPTITDDPEEEWRGMSSLPAMLLGETVGEIVDSTDGQFGRRNIDNPEMAVRRNEKEIAMAKHSRQLRRKTTEKQVVLQVEPTPSENSRSYAVNRVCPRNRPWARKTVLFPNPLFQYSSSSSPPPPEPSSLPNKSQPRGAAAMLRRSFSPSNLKRSASRLVSPFKGRRSSVHKKAHGAHEINVFCS